MNFVSDDMTVHIYVFGALMKHQIIDDMDGRPVVRVYVNSFFFVLDVEIMEKVQ